MKRLVVVYNPRSSKQALIREQVLSELGGVRGYLVGKYEVKKASLEQNARDLAGILIDGDLVLATGGDGTVTMTLNAVIQSKKMVTLSGLAYGNFNDLGSILGVPGGVKEVVRKYEADEIKSVYPLEVRIDEKHWRYALGYVTVGMLAASTMVFEEPKVREKLKTGKTGRFFSLWVLKNWYFKHRCKQILPDFELNGQKMTGMTDYLAVNGPRVGGVMKGGDWYLEMGKFGSGTKRLRRLFGLLRFMFRSMTKGMSLLETEGDVLEFEEPAEVIIQGEGEFARVRGQKIEVKKRGEVRMVG